MTQWKMTVNKVSVAIRWSHEDLDDGHVNQCALCLRPLSEPLTTSAVAAAPTSASVVIHTLCHRRYHAPCIKKFSAFKEPVGCICQKTLTGGKMITIENIFDPNSAVTEC